MIDIAYKFRHNGFYLLEGKVAIEPFMEAQRKLQYIVIDALIDQIVRYKFSWSKTII